MRMGSISTTLDQLVSETGWLRRLASRLVSDQAAVDDLVHDTYVIAAEQAPRDGRPLRPWLARVLLNRVRMRGRGAARRQARERAVAELAAPAPSPAEIVDQLEVQRMLAGLILELALPLRDVVLLHYFEGLSSVAIGKRLGIADSTARWRLTQALDELRRRLDHRTPERAWIGPLAGFAHGMRSVGAVAGYTLGFAAFAILVVLAVLAVLVFADAQGGQRDRDAARHHAAHRERPGGGLAIEAPTANPVSRDPGAGDLPATDPGQVRIAGLVVDPTGRAVAGADLAIECQQYRRDATGTHQRTTTDGGFAFNAEPGCWYTVNATRNDMAASTLISDIEIAERTHGSTRPPRPIVLTLGTRPTAVIHVVDAETGSPIANADVSSATHVFRDGSRMRGIPDAAVTGADGVARLRWLGVPWNILGRTVDIEVQVHAPGYVSVRETAGTLATIDASATIERTIRLSRGIAVRGQVVGPDGNAVPDAYVLVEPPGDHDNGWREQHVDALGGFEVVVPGPGRYVATARGVPQLTSRDDEHTEIEIDPGGRSDVVIHLEPKRPGVVGTVLDIAGNPAAGARVSSPQPIFPPVVTDARGRFAIRDVAGDFELVARRDGLASMFVPVTVRRTARPDITLQLGPAGIAGVVVDSLGAPIEGADVWLNDCCDGASRNRVRGTHAIADAQGRFSFNVPRGSFVLSVRRDPEDSYLDEDDKVVSGGSRNVTLVLP